MKKPTQESTRFRNQSGVIRCGLVPVMGCALVAAISAQPVAAQDRPVTVAAQDRPITLRLNTSSMWDGNVFRMPNSIPDPQLLTRGIPGKSDRITTSSVGLLVDKSYAQQRFQLDASQTASRYDSFTFLNTNAFQYQGAWLWHLSPRVSGTLSASRAESLVPFSDLTTTVPIKRLTESRVFNLDGWMFGGWHFLASVANTESKTSEVFLAQPGFRINAGELSLKYLAQSGNSMTATTRSSKGTNLGDGLDAALIPREFTVHDNELKAEWRISGKSALNGRLTRQERHNEGLAQRDFAATNGEISYAWSVGSKLQYNLSASRNVLPWTQDAQASYRVDNGFSFAPSLQIGNTVRVSMLVNRVVSEFLGPTAPLTGPPRRDTVRSAQLAVDWSPPMRHLQLTGSVRRERRSSNTAGLDFDDTIGTLSASLTF